MHRPYICSRTVYRASYTQPLYAWITTASCASTAFPCSIMTRKRQRPDSVVAPPASAGAWDQEAVGEFKLRSRLARTAISLADKVQAAVSPVDLLGREGRRLALLTSSPEMVAASQMQRALAFLAHIPRKHQKVAASPIQRSLCVLQRNLAWLHCPRPVGSRSQPRPPLPPLSPPISAASPPVP